MPESPMPGSRDVNLQLGGLLLDMATLAGRSQRAWGYKRAAKAVLRLDRHITPLVESNTLRAVPGIGPTTDRIARELVYDGSSSLVERAVAESGKADDIAALRRLRHGFLSNAAVREILSRRIPPSREQYRGDFQMHSVWSDGAETLDSIAEACLARGHKCAGITDHSYGLRIARGMSMEEAARQHAEVDRINAALCGTIPHVQGCRSQHSSRRDRRYGAAGAQAVRVRGRVAPLTAPYVRPTRHHAWCARCHSRAYVSWGIRRDAGSTPAPGVLADWDAVFEVAARRAVAIEIDGSWDRQDVHYELAARALAAGCIFALDSDAHAHQELEFADIAIAHARLAAIPQERIVNYWSEKQFLEWTKGAWER